MEIALLPFQRDISHEFQSGSCLCLLASGLGWQKPISALLTEHDPKSRTPILLIGFRPHQKQSLLEELERLDQEVELPVDITNSVLSNERRKLYSNGRCCFITTRILVVDFLSRKLKPTSVKGLVVCNAHRVSDDSGEAFAVRLFRKEHPTGFIRAFSDQPCSFYSGIRKVLKVLLF